MGSHWRFRERSSGGVVRVRKAYNIVESRERGRKPGCRGREVSPNCRIALICAAGLEGGELGGGRKSNPEHGWGRKKGIIMGRMHTSGDTRQRGRRHRKLKTRTAWGSW